MSQKIADEFDSPLGTADERASANIYPSSWIITNPFNNLYVLAGRQSRHTGDDLVRRDGLTAHQPLYAVANGVVICARRIFLTDGQPSTWGNLIVLRHVLPDGHAVYSRYGHSENLQIKEGDEVARGDHLSDVGNAFGLLPYHCHFDLSLTETLHFSPADWPWEDETRLLRDYIDPLVFLKEHHQMGFLNGLTALQAEINSTTSGVIYSHIGGTVDAPAREYATDVTEWKARVVIDPPATPIPGVIAVDLATDGLWLHSKPDSATTDRIALEPFNHHVTLDGHVNRGFVHVVAVDGDETKQGWVSAAWVTTE